MLLHNPDPAKYLPHRPPFLFLDRVISLEPGVSALALKKVTWEPGGYPSVFLIEAMAQLAGIAAVQAEEEGGFLAAVDRSRFFSQYGSGDTLHVAVRIIKSFGRLFMVEGKITCGEGLVATATLTLGIGKM